ncbi:GntR family transcriptional regulator [Pirellulales bacterium]|nr:GntR family transcriptional regulator [Pirellulales bacterium]
MAKADSTGFTSADHSSGRPPAGALEPTTGIHKHRRIYESLREEILAGRYRFGERVPSETRLVEQFNVSRPTAARALKDLEVHGLVERRHGSGTFVRHSASTVQRELGLLVTGLGQGEVFEPICNQLANSVAENNYELNWGRVHSDEAQDRAQAAEKTCQRLIQQRVAGVFFQPIELVSDMNDVNSRVIDALDKAKVPVVLIDSDFKQFPERSNYDLVGIDNRRVGYMLAEHLVHRGCHRIDFIAHRGASPTVDARIAGYREALFDHGITPQADWAHLVEEVDEIDIETVRELVDSGPADAYLCHNDYTASQLMRDLIQLGIHVPEDVRVVGVGDVKYASALSVPLTTIRQPCSEIGRIAVELMLQRIANPTLPARDVRLDFHLITRASCGSNVAGRLSETK